MDFDIRGLWRYKTERETCESLRDMLTAQATAHRVALAAKDEVIALQKEKAEKREKKLVSKVIDGMLEDREKLKKEYEEKISNLESELYESQRSGEELKECCKMYADDIEELKARIDKLGKMVEYRETRLNWYSRVHSDLEDKSMAQEKELTAARKEIERLKKTRYRWLDSRHGWWPVESSCLDDLAMKVPYVVYTMQKREQEGQEEQEEKRIPEV